MVASEDMESLKISLSNLFYLLKRNVKTTHLHNVLKYIENFESILDDTKNSKKLSEEDKKEVLEFFSRELDMVIDLDKSNHFSNELNDLKSKI